MSTTLTSKGQVTIPKKVRDLLGLKPGAAVDFLADEEGRILLVKAGSKAKRKSPFARLRGRATVKMTTDEIMALTRSDDAA